MKVDFLKKLIKEAVQEAVKDALDEILSEPTKPVQTPVSTVIHRAPNSNPAKYENYKPAQHKPYTSTGDPITDLLQETRAQMINQGGEGYTPNYSQLVEAPGLGMQTYDEPAQYSNPVMIEESFSRPEPGLDISQFDFVAKAASVYKASVEKDKQRFGG
jgi:hypothetical protein